MRRDELGCCVLRRIENVSGKAESSAPAYMGLWFQLRIGSDEVVYSLVWQEEGERGVPRWKASEKCADV